MSPIDHNSSDYKDKQQQYLALVRASRFSGFSFFSFFFFFFFFFQNSEIRVPSCCFANQANTIAVCSCTRCRCDQLKQIKLPIFKMGNFGTFRYFKNTKLSHQLSYVSFYLGGPPSKGFATLRNVPKVLRK